MSMSRFSIWIMEDSFALLSHSLLGAKDCSSRTAISALSVLLFAFAACSIFCLNEAESRTFISGEEVVIGV